jgi:hypothetical protein
VVLREAQHLPKMDRVGSCDAYAVVFVGGREVAETAVVPNSYEADWNHAFGIVAAGRHGADEILVELYDKDVHKEDDYIGSARISVAGLMDRGDVPLVLPVMNEAGVGVHGFDGEPTVIVLALESAVHSNARLDAGPDGAVGQRGLNSAMSDLHTGSAVPAVPSLGGIINANHQGPAVENGLRAGPASEGVAGDVPRGNIGIPSAPTPAAHRDGPIKVVLLLGLQHCFGL